GAERQAVDEPRVPLQLGRRPGGGGGCQRGGQGEGRDESSHGRSSGWDVVLTPTPTLPRGGGGRRRTGRGGGQMPSPSVAGAKPRRRVFSVIVRGRTNCNK